MTRTTLDGAKFRKMVMKATGTKGYLSSSVSKSIQSSGSKKFMQSGAKVSKRDATKVIKQLKEEGLAHKVTSNATKYVGTAYAKEERRKESIKKMNISERQKEISAEKAAEQNGKMATTKTKSSGGQGATHLQQASSMPSSSGGNTDSFVGSIYGKTNIKPQSELPTPVEKPQEWKDEEENLIDLAID
ncbi:MAG: hypothetical protein Q8P90_04680 [bacterium]|nr:hypothetical protein [bacterium]